MLGQSGAISKGSYFDAAYEASGQCRIQTPTQRSEFIVDRRSSTTYWKQYVGWSFPQNLNMLSNIPDYKPDRTKYRFYERCPPTWSPGGENANTQ